MRNIERYAALSMSSCESRILYSDMRHTQISRRPRSMLCSPEHVVDPRAAPVERNFLHKHHLSRKDIYECLNAHWFETPPQARDVRRRWLSW